MPTAVKTKKAAPKTVKAGLNGNSEEQILIKSKYYKEAIRYMDNAKEVLKKANKMDRFYQDDKYVKMACGTAYSGVLVALDGLFIANGYSQPSKKRKSIEYYQELLGKVDRKLLDYFNNDYKILHLYGYYDGITNAKVVKEGFDLAYIIIEKIKP